MKPVTIFEEDLTNIGSSIHKHEENKSVNRLLGE